MSAAGSATATAAAAAAASVTGTAPTAKSPALTKPHHPNGSPQSSSAASAASSAAATIGAAPSYPDFNSELHRSPVDPIGASQKNKPAYPAHDINAIDNAPDAVPALTFAPEKRQSDVVAATPANNQPLGGGGPLQVLFPRRSSARGSMRGSRRFGVGGSQAKNNDAPGTSGRPARAFFQREHGVFANSTALSHASKDGALVRQPLHPPASDMPQNLPNPLALLSKLDVRASGHVYVTQHGGNMKSRMFRRNVTRRFAEARGRVVLFRDDREGPVHEVFSPVGCAVSVADTVMSKRGAVEHNVNIAKGGHTLQMRFQSEGQADHWAEVLAAMAATRMPKLADFSVVAPIGEGASGKVFLVRDRKTSRKLALKCMNKSASALASNSSDSRHAIDERVTHETMNGSQYIVGLRHAFQTRNKLYLATEFCDGGDVYNYVDSRGGGVSEPQARLITAQVVLGLKKLHDANIIFRDLKPENVLITGDGRVRLADFGLCKQFDASAALTRTVCGTFSYAAAEILSGQGYGRSCDLWALGVFLYHIMIGRPPRVSASIQEAKANIFDSKEPIIWYSDVMSEHAMSLVTALIEVDPARRLGCGPMGIAEVCEHPFFKGIDWAALATGTVPVDIKDSLPAPELGDLRNFNQEEWANIQMDPDRDDPDYVESMLWPLRNIATHPLPPDFVVSYSYSAETLGKGASVQ